MSALTSSAKKRKLNEEHGMLEDVDDLRIRKLVPLMSPAVSAKIRSRCRKIWSDGAFTSDVASVPFSPFISLAVATTAVVHTHNHTHTRSFLRSSRSLERSPILSRRRGRRWLTLSTGRT